MTPLRGHHLICLHFFRGEGYGPEFLENLESVIDRSKQEGIVVQNGADNICIKCPNLAGELCMYKGDNNKKIEGLDAIALRLLNLEHGAKTEWAAMERVLPQIFHEWKDEVCFKCDWLGTCKSTTRWKNLD
ncbi:DUF1284 domain-containing protein [archaeon]|nr:DUF1284 domain-containing protein [archaeon]